MLRFHMDEQVSSALPEGLRRLGLDVRTTVEQGLHGAPDEEHVEVALAEGRVIVTHDADFPRLHTAGVSHAGIVYSAFGARSIGDLVCFLQLLSECLDPEDMIGRLEYA